jgi:hypothetical protein
LVLGACAQQTEPEPQREDADPGVAEKRDFSTTPAPANHNKSPFAASTGAPGGLSDGERKQMQAEVERVRVAESAELRAISRVSPGLAKAKNPLSGLDVAFTERGVALDRNVGAGEWKASMSLARFGREGALEAVAAEAAPQVDGYTINYDRGRGVTEWYDNADEGLEHGFTVKEKPAGDASTLRFEVALEGAVASASPDGALIFARGEEKMRYGGLKAWDATGRDLRAEMRPVAGGFAIDVDDAGAQYPVTVDPIFTQVSQLGAAGLTVGFTDTVQNAVAVDGDRALVAGRLNQVVYVYERSGGVWAQASTIPLPVPSSGPNNDFMGWGMDLEGDRAVMTEPNKLQSYVFERNGAGVWTLVQTLTSTVNNQVDASLSGNALMIAGYPTSFGTEVYARSGGTFSLIQTIPTAGARGTYAVEVNGSHALLAGDQLRTFDFSGGTWTLSQTLPLSPGVTGNVLAWDGGDIAVVGSTNGSGIEIFERSAGVWSSSSVIVESGQFGRALAVANARVLVGNPAVSRVSVYEKVAGTWQSVEVISQTGLFGEALAADPNGVVAVTNPTPVNVTFFVGGAIQADDDNATTDEDTAVTVDVLANDTQGPNINITAVSTPSNGAAAIVNNEIVYTPNLNYNGGDSFNYTISDGSGSTSATVTVTVNPVNDAPVGTTLDFSVPEDGSRVVTLAGNDVENNPITFAIVTPPVNGELTGTIPDLIYTPDPNYNGPDSFTYSISDAQDSSQRTVNITVTPVNDRPIADPQAITIDEDNPGIAVTLTGSDLEDGNNVTYTLANQPNHGTVTGTPPNVVYTPNPNYNGTDGFLFSVQDTENLVSDPATIFVTINPVNDVPVGTTPDTSTLEDTPTLVSLSGADVEGSQLSFTNISATNGSISGNAPDITFTPAPNFTGNATITYTVSDGGASSVDTVNVQVLAVNDRPVANAQSVSVDEDNTLGITLTGTDVEDGAGPFGFVVVGQPTNGSLSGSVPNLTYTPDPDFNGADSFTFTVTDSQGSTSTQGTISVTVDPVNDAPVAQDRTGFQVPEDTAFLINLGASDIDSANLTFSLVGGQPANGTLDTTRLAAEGIVTYLSDLDYNGPDSFQFRVNDGALDSNTATVSFEVINTADSPVAQDGAATTDEDNDVTITLIATDPDSDPLTYAIVDQPPAGQGAVTQSMGNQFVYSPPADYNGSTSFTFTATDTSGNTSNTARVGVTVNPVNDRPVANAQSVSVNEDDSVTFTLSGSDVEGTQLTFSVPARAGDGALVQNGAQVTYTPDPDFNGADSFTFTASDGDLTSAPATVDVTVNAINDRPKATTGLTAVTDEDTPVGVAVSGSDVEDGAGPFVVNVVSSGSGTTSVSGQVVTYTPALNANGGDTFTYTVTDSGGSTSAPATVGVTINPVNDAPVAQAQSVSVDEDDSRVIRVAGTDVEDGGPASFQLVGSVTNGVLQGTLPEVTYIPRANYNGPDSFAFTVTDAQGAVSAPATVSITVDPVNDDPVAFDRSFDFNEDIARVLIMNTEDIDNDPLTFIIVDQPQHGTITGTGPAFTYTPDAEYNGFDSFTFKVNDGTVDSNLANVSLRIQPTNDTPDALPQALTMDEDDVLPITLVADDPDDPVLTYTISRPPSSGQIVGQGENITFVPAFDFNGEVTFGFVATDDEGSTSQEATVTITVDPVNDAPRPDARTVTVLQDGDLTFTLTGTDPEGDAFTFAVSDQPDNGTLDATNLPSVTYTPNAGYVGNDSFQITGTDSNGATSQPVTISIDVTNVADAPLADDQSVTTGEDSPLSVTLTATDPDMDPLTFRVTGQPQNGTVSGNAPNVTYTPNANFNGTDTFRFVANDGAEDSAEGIVTVTVTPAPDAPIAQAATVELDEDTASTFNLVATDADGDALTYTVSSQPANGTLDTTNLPEVVYTPDADFNGTDTFEFTANDGAVDSAPAVITLEVDPVNDAPVGDALTVNVSEDTPQTFTLTGTDAEGDALTFAVASQPANGTLDTTNLPDVTYTPGANFTGIDSFTFVANDGAEDSLEATVTLDVGQTNDAPAAVGQVLTLDEDTSLAVTLGALDPEGDALTFTVTSQPLNGTLSGLAPNLTYTPDADFNGADSFAFIANDGALDSAPGLIELTVAPVNDAPTAGDVSVTVRENGFEAIFLDGADVDGDALTYTIVSQPQNGTLTGSGRARGYQPDANYSGPDSLTYTVSDGAVTSNVATVTINVSNVQQPPTASDASVTTDEDTAASITLAGADPDGDALTFRVTQQPTNGALSGTGANLTYTPNADYNGSDELRFVTNDGNADSVEAVVSITVSPVNDAPTAADVMAATEEEMATMLTLVGADVDGDALTYTVEDPANGTVSGDGPTITYTPDADFDGTETFTYTVSDGELTSAPATVTVVVTDAPNVAPTFVDPTPEDGTLFEVTDGQELTFTVAADDPDSGPLALAYELDGAPEGSTFDANTGAFSWTPTIDDVLAGDITLLARATDGLATIEREFDVSLSLADPDALLCAADERVADGACEACPAGTTNEAGDDSTGADTECEAVLCAEDEFVSGNACEVCPEGTVNEAGDDASGADTECDIDEPIDGGGDLSGADEGCCATAPARTPRAPIVLLAMLVGVIGLVRTRRG